MTYELRFAATAILLLIYGGLSGCTFEKGPSGVVLDTDGAPASGAEVVLAAPGHPVTWTGEALQGNVAMRKKTDEDGTFAVQWAITPYAIVAATENGIVKVVQEEHEDGGRLQVQPFGRIEGKLALQDEGPAQILRLGSIDDRPWEPTFNVTMEAEPEEDGRFTFEKVPAGLVVLSAVESGDERQLWSVPVDVTAGKTSTAGAAAGGRTLTGKLVFPEKIERNALEEGDHAALHGAPENPELPEDLDDAGWETWQEEWSDSEAGQAHLRHQARTYALLPEEDGSFTVEGVAPGRYALVVTLYDDEEEIGTYSEMIEVPAEGNGPMALGDKQIQAVVHMEPGVEAPPFTAKLLDGGEISLAQYRGKYVFLDFWATWCGPCRGEMPYLKEAYEAFKDDERFVLISLSLDGAIEDPQAYVKENELHWTHAWLGEWSETPVPDQYGVDGIPTTFLIDPEGKILEIDLRGEDVIPGIREYLGEDSKS